MAKITRYNGNFKAFAADAGTDERFIFGTTTPSDDITDNLNSLFFGGWYAAVPEGAYPPEQWFNAVSFAVSQTLAYLHQIGVAEYNAAQVYYTNSFCNYNGILYRSLIDDNIAITPDSDPTKWKSIYYSPALLGTPTAPTPTVGDSSTKIATTEFVSQNGGLPIGGWCYYDGYGIPAGFLPRDGSAVSRTTYSLLYAASILVLAGETTNGSPIITGLSSTTELYVGQQFQSSNFTGIVTILTIDSGTEITASANATAGSTVNHTFHLNGAGDGSTTFNIADGRGRSPMGAGQGSGLTNRIAGQVLGHEGETPDVTQLTPHDHVLDLIVPSSVSAQRSLALVTANVTAPYTTRSTGGGLPVAIIHPSEVRKSIVRYG